MILRLGYDIQFEIPASVTMVALLSVHPSRLADLRAPDEVHAALRCRWKVLWIASEIVAPGLSRRKGHFV
jgi:hypothetical protein